MEVINYIATDILWVSNYHIYEIILGRY